MATTAAISQRQLAGCLASCAQVVRSGAFAMEGVTDTAQGGETLPALPPTPAQPARQPTAQHPSPASHICDWSIWPSQARKRVSQRQHS